MNLFRKLFGFRGLGEGSSASRNVMWWECEPDRGWDEWIAARVAETDRWIKDGEAMGIRKLQRGDNQL